MRVAFVHSGYSRHLISGIIRVETELVLALQRRGHVAEIMQWDKDGEKTAVGQQYRRIVRPASAVYRDVRDFITAGQYDVVVFQGVGYPETRALPWLKRETNAKFIIIQHGWPLYSTATRFLVNGYMQTVGHILLREADAVVAVSEYVRSHLASFIEPDRISVIYPGVDTSRFRPLSSAPGQGTQSTVELGEHQATKAELRKRLGITQRYALLVNGKLAAHKNIPTLLRALQQLPHTQLLVVGKGSATKEAFYKELARSLGVADRVTFLGLIPNEHLPSIYGAVDLLVHPSRSETLGIVLLESLACATPVVAANVGGIPEVVTPGFNGSLYEDAKDHEGLARAVRLLLADPQNRAELGRNGRAFVAARFDWSNIIPQYLSLFERVHSHTRQTTVDDEAQGVFGAFA